MIAQVRAANLAAQRRKRQHLAPLDAHRVQAATEIPMSGDRAHAVVVDEQADGDAAGDGAFEGLVEGGRVLVPGRLVVQGVHVVGGRVDAGGHGSEGFGRVVVQAADAPRRGRESAQISGQAHDRGRVAVRAKGQAVRPGGNLVGRGLWRGRVRHDGVDEGSGLRVVVEATSHRPPRAKNNVQGHAEEGPQEDQQQPRGRRRGAAMLGNNPQGDNADHEIDGPDKEPPPQRGFGRRRKHAPSLSSAPGPGRPSAASVARRSARRARARGCGVRPRRGRRSRWRGRPRPRWRRNPR